MGFWDFATFATGAGCLTAIVLAVVNSTLGARARRRDGDLKLVQENSDRQEQRIAELSRQNEQLLQQLEWNGRLVESYERALGQPESPTGDGRVLVTRARDRN
jgi:hypothetical protein